ncbi:YciI family protein [Microbacterium sp. 179-B 1A2 NHS]|uniref:YciI family protein n=1 Tax=Microbacterium sp. 179-B 1A2 NHS TaxID=3142383 RepID=UPI0039A2060C
MRILMLVLSDSAADPDEVAPFPIEQWADEAYGSGRASVGDRLRPAAEAKTIRQRDGEITVSDGPAARAFDRIEGFDVLECETIDDAIELASRHPMAVSGVVQLHPAWPLDL